MNSAQAVIVGGIFAVLIGLNVLATCSVYNSDFYEAGQKRMQYGLIWLFPVLGALLCYGLARQNSDPHSGHYSEVDFLYDGGSLGIENADADYFNGGGGHV